MIAFVTAWIGRLLAAWIAGFFGWLMVRYGIAVPDAAQTKLVEAIVGVVIPIAISLYAIVHKLIDAKVNPADAAKGREVEDGKIRANMADRKLR
jgi:hypothetical protein